MTEPATRARTALFLSLREPRFPPARWKGKGRAEDGDEEEALLESGMAEPSNPLPPSWVDTVDTIDTILDNLTPRIAALDKLHAKHARPGFKDRSAEEAEIQRQTTLITDQFRRCQALLQRLAATGDPAVQDPLLANVRMGLATKLQETSSFFRKKQSNYLRLLKGFEIKQSDLRAASGDDPLRHQPNAVEDDLQLLHTTANPNALAADVRVAEIDAIASSITELADLFRDLSAMVIDQGTLLDRVDYNVEQMAVHAQGAAEELKTAAAYQRRSGKRSCIFLLILCIIALIVVIFMKKKKP